MPKRAKITKGLLVFLFTLTSLLAVGIIIAPKLISNAAVSNKVRSEVSRMLDCEFDFKQLELSFFPRLKVVVDTLKINVPRQLSVSVKEIEIYPEILPLLTGNVALKKAIINGPKVRILMPESTPGEKSSTSPSETDPSTSSVSNAISELSKMYLPITRGIVTQGSIELVYDKNTTFKVNDVEADLKNELKNLSFQIRAIVDMMPVSGSFIISEAEPKFRSQLEIRDLDINSARSAILAAVGENTAVQTVFDILKGGKIPLVTVSGQANTPADFENLDTFIIQGQVMDGIVKIPGTGLEMAAVKGDVKILHGVLAGKNIQDQWGNSSIQSGSLKLDLAKDPMPLRVETGITANMADIPAILDRIVQDQDFKNELAQLENVKGSARGKLQLTGDADNLEMGIVATDIDFVGRYKKIPYPLTLVSLNNGSLSYDGNKIGWEQLSGSLGASFFSGFSGSLELEGVNDFSITSGTSRILLPELLPWISTHAKTQKLPGYLSGGKGILQLSKVLLNGQLEDFSNWQFNIAGDLEDFVFQNLPGDPGPLKIGTLNFTADPQTLEYAHGQISVHDTSLEISGIHKLYMTDFNGDAKWTFEGQVGQQTVDWLSKTVDMPDWLKFRPLSFAPSHLAASNQGGQKLTADLSFQDGLGVSADLTVNPNEVVLKKLKIKDKDSQASFAGLYKDPSIEVSFEGNLHESTLEKLFSFSSPLATSIDGKARARVNLKTPLYMSFDGNLNGKNLYIPLGMGTPLLINHIAAKGEPEEIKIESADLSWDDMALTLSGNINPDAGKSLTFDLDIAADTIDVKKIMDHFEEENRSTDQKSVAPTRSAPILVPIKGDIRLKAEQFKTKALTIQPLYADIRVQDKIVDIKIKKANLCGIPATGTIKISQENIEYHLEPIAQAQHLSTTMN
ncbi:MAG: hypothetical protein QNK40_16560, partial [Desulfobacterales bacterium]|nr:hypothetical protein [Desulfobacterales bacterium]